MQITSGNIAARCPLCHYTSFRRVGDKHPAMVTLMMCNACGTETEYSVLVAELAHFASCGREASAA